MCNNCSCQCTRQKTSSQHFPHSHHLSEFNGLLVCIKYPSNCSGSHHVGFKVDMNRIPENWLLISHICTDNHFVHGHHAVVRQCASSPVCFINSNYHQISLVNRTLEHVSQCQINQNGLQTHKQAGICQHRTHRQWYCHQHLQHKSHGHFFLPWPLPDLTLAQTRGLDGSKYWDVTTCFCAFIEIPKSVEIFSRNF